MVAPETVSYAAGTLAMIAGLGISLRLLAETEVDGKFGYLAIIPGFAALAYALMTLGVGTVSIQGYTVPALRYVDWLVTTPILVGYAAYVAGAGRTWIVGTALADAVMIVLGGVAVASAPPLRWIAFGASSAAHLGLLGAIYVVFPAYSSEQNSKRRRLAEILRNHVGLLWIAYPVIWLVGPGLQVVSATAVAMIVAYLDVVAKVPYVYFVYRARDSFGDATRPEREHDPTGGGVAASGD